MKKLTIYTSRCLCDSNSRIKKLELEQFAREFGFDIDTKRTQHSREWQQEARELSGLATPFVYNNESGKSVSLGSDYTIFL